MNDTLFVRRCKRVGNLPCDVQCFINRQRTPRDSLREVLALDELHHERALMPAGVWEDFDSVDLRDVGVLERAQQVALSRHAARRFWYRPAHVW